MIYWRLHNHFILIHTFKSSIEKRRPALNVLAHATDTLHKSLVSFFVLPYIFMFPTKLEIDILCI